MQFAPTSALRLALVFVLCVAFVSAGKTKAEWKSRTIYQIFTDRFARNKTASGACNLSKYCGGSYTGIIDHLDYIQNLGFDAIWINPIIENTPDGYHGYWAKNFYRFNTNFGNATEFIRMLNECHKRDIWVMVDAVFNHIGPVGTNYTTIYPFNQTAHYHDCVGCPADCNIANWRNMYEVEHCRLSGLPDLDQDNAFVNDELLNWAKWMTTTFDIDGLRLDTIPEVSKAFWQKLSNTVDLFMMGECFDGEVSFVAGYQEVLDSLLSYPLYFTLQDTFLYGNTLRNLESKLQEYKNNFKDTSVLGTFIDNHDNRRWLNFNSDISRYKNALVFTLLADGIPIVYYGTEQGFTGGIDPANREPLWETNFSTNHELYAFLAKVNSVRRTNKVWNYEQVQRYADDIFYSFTRGNVLVALTNVGSKGQNVVRSLTYHPYADGTVLCNVFWENDCIQVSGGKVNIILLSGEVKIFVPK